MTTAAHTSPHTRPDVPDLSAATPALAGVDPAQATSVRRDLLDWYGKQRRSLPWRTTRDPYCIWVSEVMLQQPRWRR
jgi:hypothetical protein